jgi:hypothetical protein
MEFSAITGLGNYKLDAQFSAALRTADEMCLLSCYSPEEIPKKIMCIEKMGNESRGTSDESTCMFKEKQDDDEVSTSRVPSSTPYARAR